MAISLPARCPRCREDCGPLSQIESDSGESFICCGHNTARNIPQDRFRLCFKNGLVDEMTDNDEADLHDLLSVIAQALSVDAHMSRMSRPVPERTGFTPVPKGKKK